MASMDFQFIFTVLMLAALVLPVMAVSCPHCGGNFASCTYAHDQKCPTVTIPVDNAAVIAAGQRRFRFCLAWRSI